jgi:uncharacterized membrane protein
VVAFIFGPVHGFMIWNLFLATVPAALSLILFRNRGCKTGGCKAGGFRNLRWWVGLTVWILFLPNAPYVLTDVVHMVGAMRNSPNDRHAYLVMATYAVLFAGGLASYAFSMQRFRRYLHRAVADRLVAPLILFVHALCVLAMYLGRAIRLNSWDVVTAPNRVVASVMRVPRPLTVFELAVTFVVVGVAAFAAMAVGDKAVAHCRRWLPL